MKSIIIIIIIIINFWRQKCDQEKTEKILKYKDLKIEIQRMWNVKAKVIPVIIGATGIISKSLRQYLRNIPGRNCPPPQKKKPYWVLHTYCGKC
jgi:hypothetical protein